MKNRVLARILLAMMMVASALALTPWGTAALADGEHGKTVQSRKYGNISLASYVGDYNGYKSADGCVSSGGDRAHVTVISKSASVWSEPRTNSNKLGSVEHGKSLSCREEGMRKDGFYAVELNGKSGWINEDYVVMNGLNITLMESNVPAYIAPDAQAKKVGSLSKMTSYPVIGFYDDYYIINLRGAAAAYVPMSVRHYDSIFYGRYAGAKPMASVTVDAKVEVRTGPGGKYPELRKTKAGERVDVYDVIDGWYMVKESDGWGFIASDSLNVQL